MQLKEETKLFKVVNILNYIPEVPGLDLYSDEVYSDCGFCRLLQFSRTIKLGYDHFFLNSF
jgi:hypothetical protein